MEDQSNPLFQYKTKDLGEAAALLCTDFKLIQLDQDDGFYWFVFDNSSGEAERISHRYWFGNLLIQAKKFSDSVRTLKDRLYARK